MTRAVGQALDRRRRALVEAGTGVGKSRAYLAPLLLWARVEGRRAVVATHTVNLQEQLVDREVPVLREAIDDAPEVVLLKGRNHYISLRRWERFLASGAAGDRDRLHFMLKVLVWLAGTSTGDRSELHLTGAEEQCWRWIASDAEDCLGSLCANWGSRRCHMVAARQRAADAPIVVTNHALLLSAAEPQSQVLPEYQALVVDEAHHLEAAATQQLGTAVAAADLWLILDRLPVTSESAAGTAVARCREAGHRLFGDIKGFVGRWLGGAPGNVRIGLDDQLRATAEFGVVLRSARHAAGVLESAARTLADNASSAVQAALLPQPDRADDELGLAAASLSLMAARIERILCAPVAGTVGWLELRGEQAEIHEAPVSVAEAVQERLLEPRDTVVLTSATLTVGGSFQFVRSRLGVGDAAEELSLASPFDYLRQALCVVPEAIPPYDEPAHEHAVSRLVAGVAERFEGRTLVLFTSYGPLRRVQALVRDRLEHRGIAVLGQGIDGTRRQILRSFLEDPRTVLLGTSSFWEGVDIPSERLRCVIIDKLPFAVPTDPLVRARTQGLRDAFGQYVLPLAVLRLRQGFGRLIRSHADRGAVILCDERLNSREYGDVFLRALPPAAIARPPLDDIPAVVEAFVRGTEPQSVRE
jgi:DNA polymerase III subunit epsilon